jgi:glycosyltransferase involved in cell wall biosynthesis
MQRLLLPLERPVVNRAAAIITYNAVGRNRFITKYGYPADRISIIPKPIDVPRWRRPELRDEARASLGISPDTFVVAYSGRLTRFRGSTALAAAARMANADARFNDVMFLFIGGTMSSDVDVAEYRGPNTIVTGMIPNDEMPAMLAATDAMVFPDLTTKAGFTTALAEAMAAALPIIVGANAEQGSVPLEDGVDALFCESGSAASILDAVSRLKAEPALARSLGDGAGRLASDTMDYPRVASAYLDILERVVADGRPH